LTADEAGCCGALAHHLNDTDARPRRRRRNIDAWIPHLDAGVEAIVMTASGCGVMVKDYGWLLRDDPVYAEKAARVSAATRDISEVLVAERDALKGLASRHRTETHRLPPPLHPAARTEARGQRRGDAGRCRVRAHCGGREAPVLRLGRHLFDPAAEDRQPAERHASSAICRPDLRR
jgi:hypothetical protein